MSDDALDSRVAWAMLLLFVLIALMIGWDLFVDYRSGSGWAHLAVEFGVLFSALLGMFFLARQLQRTHRGLGLAQAEAEQWRSETQMLMKGLGAAIQNQFARWNLSSAEAEIALLMLKGLSHKDIAALRHTSERTVREQARAVYRKSGLPGRSALSSFFLEDLLPPR